jgi:hypothetical protein
MQRNVLLSAFVAVLALGLAASAVPPRPRPGARAGGRAEAALADPLAGQSFDGESGEQGKPTGERDTLEFRDGRFRSTACDAYGFGDAPYRVTKTGGRISFDAVTTSVKEGRMSWHGELEGDTLSGTAVWTKPGQSPAEYWFKATRRR